MSGKTNDNCVNKRSKEIIDTTTIQDIGLGFENMFKLGQATIIGFFFSLVESNENFTSEDFKATLKEFIKDDIQLRCDAYGIMGEYLKDVK